MNTEYNTVYKLIYIYNILSLMLTFYHTNYFNQNSIYVLYFKSINALLYLIYLPFFII